MKLSELKNKLITSDAVNFIQSNGVPVPSHFHVTEVGLTTKHFIDCGGTVREEKYVNFQLWEANDLDHRLSSEKLMKIIDLSEKTLNLGDFEVEVEYQTSTIGRYGLDFDGNCFILTSKKTDCLAKDTCGAPKEKSKINLLELNTTASACCTPESGCCN